MSPRSFRYAGVSAATALMLAGCSLAPDYQRPAAPVAQQYPDLQQAAAGAAREGTQSAAAATPQVAHTADLGWRQFFRDPRLQALIGIALENNRDMRIAVQNVLAAQAQYGIQAGARLPTIGLQGSSTITSSSQSVRRANGASTRMSRSLQAGVGISSFELDFFGRIKNLTKAAYEQYLATQEAQRTVQISLIGEVAQAYFNLRSAEQQADLLRKTMQSRQSTYDLVQSTFNNGVASALDVAQAKAQLDASRADLQATLRAQSQARNALQLVLGEPIPADLPAGAVFGRDQMLSAVPIGLPSDLLERRPDIMQAEHNLKAADANIGAARAQFFPNISITALLGLASPALSGLFQAGNGMWSFSPTITQPLFAGGSLAGNLDLAKANQKIAVAQYEKAIQTAFREVADALAGEATYSSQLDALRSEQTESQRALDLAQIRYKSGVDSFLQVQTAAVNLYAVQSSFLQAGLDSLVNRVNLYKALGGGWLENSGAPAAAAAQAPAGQAGGAPATAAPQKTSAS
ncbi:efflux transporter outer membrane subunit [Candidimonas nitroreducens]|uniref:Multidrug transporter n=1 Tax=Candidimonas nitroreducens TaxID=683354 RepID=A0A225MVU5_9BURK|nr:efflux transporter outer membrane subunit [Candidimonas nitroreducens]OWT65517.1 multidrug transporter [Candidimonas nitroreducens]